MSVDLETKTDDVHEGLDAVIGLRSTLGESKESLFEFRETIASLPRMTTMLNKAKRSAIGAMDKLFEQQSNSDVLLGEAEKVIRDLLDG